ncbi:MAG: GumC family protein, partial [Hyphomicrobiaceae bacterium]
TLAKQTVLETDEVQRALEPKIVRLRDEVQQAEAEVERFKAAKDIFKGGPQGTGLNVQQLGDLTAELTKAKAARSEAEARAKSARELMRAGSAEAQPDVQKSPLIQSLAQQRVRLEREISELSATLLPGHPRMRQLNADLDGLRRQIATEVAKVADSLEKEAKVAAMREASVAKSLDEMKSQVVSTSTSEVELRALEAVAKSKRSELERLQSQYEANKVRADSRAVPVEAQINSTALASSVPVFPKKGPYTALAAVATLLLGIAWVITRALLVGARGGNPANPKRRASDHAAPEAMGAAMRAQTQRAGDVAAVPLAATNRATGSVASKSDRGNVAAADDAAGVAEISTVARLARQLRAIAPEKGGFRTLVAGETNLIDASTEAIELAEELEREGLQVVLIDWSASGAGFARQSGLATTPGIVDLMLGNASFEDVIQSIPGSSVHVIASGSPLDPDGPADQLDDERLNLLLDALDEAYDHIIVTGRYEEARLLFETIQGRVDAGITVGDLRRKAPALSDPPGTFLGFEVTDIELLRLNRAEVKASSAQKYVRRGGGPQLGVATA